MYTFFDESIIDPKFEIPDDIDSSKPFRVNPYPSRSEWKEKNSG